MLIGLWLWFDETWHTAPDMHTGTFILILVTLVAILATGCSSPNPVIVFESDPDGDADRPNFLWDGTYHEIWVMDADGSNQTRLTTNDTWNRYPSWSPDGSKIAFSSIRSIGVFPNTRKTHGIWVMDADGSNQTNLFNSGGVFEVTFDNLSWSPDGSKIAFDSHWPPPHGIWVMDADGSNITQLTYPPGSIIDIAPSWSPDGSKIAFHSTRGPVGGSDATPFKIYVMDADGSNLTRLTEGVYRGEDRQRDEAPSWSPDGSKIVFRSCSYGGGATGFTGCRIYVMDVDGSNQTPLAGVDSWSQIGDLAPSWSPDGSKIVFLSARDNRVDHPRRESLEIYIMDADGSNPTRLTNNLAVEGRPSWRPAE